MTDKIIGMYKLVVYQSGGVSIMQMQPEGEKNLKAQEPEEYTGEKSLFDDDIDAETFFDLLPEDFEQSIFNLPVWESLPSLQRSEQTQNSKASERIQQIMEVVEEVQRRYNNFMQTRDGKMIKVNIVGEFATSAMKEVAANKGISPQTVNDKCCRQLGLQKKEFVELLDEYLRAPKDYTGSRLYAKILSCISSDSDIEYIEESFERMGERV